MLCGKLQSDLFERGRLFCADNIENFLFYNADSDNIYLSKVTETSKKKNGYIYIVE